MKSDRNILVTGATGHQGGAVARELLARGYQVRAMTRHPETEKARRLAELGAQVVQGDLDDEASVAEALRGVWGAFAVQNTWEAGVEREEEQGKRFAQVARKVGVEHFVYSSVASAHRRTGIPHFDNKWRIEEVVRGLKFPSHTIVRPVFFMENLLSPPLKSALDQGKLPMALKPETTLQMIAVADVGRYGAWAFENHEALNGRAIDIAGDAQTMPATAKILSSAAGRKIEFAPLPIEEVRKSSEDYAIMLEWFDAVGFNADIKALARESGIRPKTLAEWAAKIDWTPSPQYAATLGG
jgi:uncharacterized protein YbjT (DUF2867 family)